jgi:hypothetical protein
MRPIEPVKKTKPRAAIIIILLGLSPIIPVILASIGGACLGCPVNEAGGSKCIRWGIDFGETFSTMMMMGWLLIYTIPLAGISLLIRQIFIHRKQSHKDTVREQQ